MKISIAFQTDKPLAAYGALAAQAEAYGFDAVTVYNDLLYQPAWLPLMEMARATKHIRVGVAAVNPFTCHPVNIAGNIALIDEVSNGRAYLGIARGAWLEFLNIEPPRSTRAMREAMECVKHLLARKTEPYRGKFFSLAGGDTLRWNILRADIPILLGTWGEQTIRACLPHVAEIKLGGTTNPALVKRVREFLHRECEKIGRAPNSVGIVVGAVSVVDNDGAAARALAKREVALYLPVVMAFDKTLEMDGDWRLELRDFAARGDSENVARMISDDLLKHFAFAGTVDEIAEQTRALFDAGASRVEFGTPHGFTEEEGMRLLGVVIRDWRLETGD
jgi:5,10-methylenetetrahydromethanopterin reductase